MTNATRQAVEKIQAILDSRDRDSTRLEGRFDQIAATVVQMIGQVQAATASTDALWLSLKVLHPDAVPVRASDRVASRTKGKEDD